MNISFDNIKDKNVQNIYRHLWENNSFSAGVVPTSKNNSSYEFEFVGKNLVDFVAESLANNFDIKDLELFKEKFRMACSGTGDELKKITTLHSSSLCALLFFFNITEKNYLKIKGLDGYTFTKSFFEFKNKVIGYPSNIDIVLFGTKLKGEKVILFLESKFSEYITSIKKAGKTYEIGASYFKNEKSCFSKPIYDELEKSNILEKIVKDKKIYLRSNKDKYIEGLKQLISHYYGIRNFIEGEYYEKDNDNLKELQDFNASEFILGEILFDNFGDELNNAYLKPYEDDYKKLADIINKQYKEEKDDSKFRMLENSFHYSDLNINCCASSKIRQYYFGENQ